MPGDDYESYRRPGLPTSLEDFKEKLESLVRKFDADRDHYVSKQCAEAQARVDFVTPFFKALGWDVENEAGLPHHDREVFVEKGEAETEGRPDYNFRVNGQTKFFVEAKAPSEPLDAARHILQAKGYAWNVWQAFLIVGQVFSLAWLCLSLSSCDAVYGSIPSDSFQNQILARTSTICLPRL